MSEEIKNENVSAQEVADAKKAIEEAQKAIENAQKIIDMAQSAAKAEEETQKTVEEMIEDILETVIRPAVGEHGGDADLNYVEDGVAYINLSGACAGCPSADTETRGFIEQQLTAVIPEIQRVEIDNTIPNDIFDEMRAMFSKSYGKDK